MSAPEEPNLGRVSAKPPPVAQPFAIPAGPRHAALVEHRLPDGTRHWDWFIERRPPQANAPVDAASGVAAPDERRLAAFRVQTCPLQGSSHLVTEFTAEPTSDHRAVYLRHTGEVSAGRGAVRPVAGWVVAHTSFAAVSMAVVLEADGIRTVYVGVSCRPGVWRFVRI